ncbi:MAG: hypothetical protein ACR2HN_08040 [Tepidiformaceae bacterium]
MGNIGSRRWVGVAGIVFALCLVSGFILLDLPGHDDGDQLVADFYASGAGRARVIAANYLIGAAALAFVGFVGLLSRGPEGRFTSASLFALGAAVLLAAGGATQGPTYALSIDAFDEPLAVVTRFQVHQAYGMILHGYLFAGVAVVLLCRLGSIPRGLTIIGYVVGVLCAATILFLPLFLLPAWVFATGIALLIRPGQGHSTTLGTGGTS